MMDAVDSIIKVPNDRLFEVMGEKKIRPLLESFKLADDALRQAFRDYGFDFQAGLD